MKTKYRTAGKFKQSVWGKRSVMWVLVQKCTKRFIFITLFWLYSLTLVCLLVYYHIFGPLVEEQQIWKATLSTINSSPKINFINSETFWESGWNVLYGSLPMNLHELRNKQTKSLKVSKIVWSKSTGCTVCGCIKVFFLYIFFKGTMCKNLATWWI